MTAGNAGFVNREREIGLIQEFIPPQCNQSSILFVTAPSGFGKSALVDRAVKVALESHRDLECVVVDPSIRKKSTSSQITEGLFAQRMAESLSGLASANGLDSFQEFLQERGKQTAREKNYSDLLRKWPSTGHYFEEGVDVLERYRASGKYSAESVLRSDARGAVLACEEYVTSVCRRTPILAIIREAQHIDHQSLRFLLQLNRTLPAQHLIFEYTSGGNFSDDDEKIILEEIRGHPRVRIYELHQLEAPHFNSVLRGRVGDDVALPSSLYEKWNGNLRAIEQISYRVETNRGHVLESDVTLSLADLGGQIGNHLCDLQRDQQMLLAIVAAHVEGIDHRALFAVASQIAPRTSSAEWQLALNQLISPHNFVVCASDIVRLNDEDVAQAINDTAQISGLVAIGRKALRDYYLSVLRERNFTIAGFAIAARQALVLCAETGDFATLADLAIALNTEIREANDQSVYIDAIVRAISTGDGTRLIEQVNLLDWCVALAYDTSDFRRTAEILSIKGISSPVEASIMACCEQELGEHANALDLAKDGRKSWPGVDGRLAADLIEFLVLRDKSDLRGAGNLLSIILESQEYQTSALRGYALRFSEAVNGLPRCFQDALQSADWFDQFGLRASQAYSQQAAAVHAARLGKGDIAQDLLLASEAQLSTAIRDQHMLLNNRAAVTMLVLNADFEMCLKWLERALRTSRDHYSDVTILNNMAIANLNLGNVAEAVDCVERALRVLEGPDFSEKDIFWEVAFTAMNVFTVAGNESRALEMRDLPPRRPIVNEDYWNYRFGLSTAIGVQYSHLLKFDYHPLYLSHWLIDREGLEMLRVRLPE